MNANEIRIYMLYHFKNGISDAVKRTEFFITTFQAMTPRR